MCGTLSEIGVLSYKRNVCVCICTSCSARVLSAVCMYACMYVCMYACMYVCAKLQTKCLRVPLYISLPQEYKALVHRRKMLLRIAECSAIFLGRAAAADSAGIAHTHTHIRICSTLQVLRTLIYKKT